MNQNGLIEIKEIDNLNSLPESLGRRCCTPENQCDEGEGDCDGPGRVSDGVNVNDKSFLFFVFVLASKWVYKGGL